LGGYRRDPAQPPRRLRDCHIRSFGGIPELAYAGVPALILGIAIFWRVIKRYPKVPPE
jgi:hypothetical protein